MWKLGALAALLTIAAPLAALPQNYTAEDEAACTPDVMRLCQQFVPNRPTIIACMMENKRQLSPECSAVFSRPASAQQSAEDERRRRRKPSAHSPN
jgi:hypothetical protein